MVSASMLMSLFGELLLGSTTHPSNLQQKPAETPHHQFAPPVTTMQRRISPASVGTHPGYPFPGEYLGSGTADRVRERSMLDPRSLGYA